MFISGSEVHPPRSMTQEPSRHGQDGHGAESCSVLHIEVLFFWSTRHDTRVLQPWNALVTWPLFAQERMNLLHSGIARQQAFYVLHVLGRVATCSGFNQTVKVWNPVSGTQLLLFFTSSLHGPARLLEAGYYSHSFLPSNKQQGKWANVEPCQANARRGHPAWVGTPRRTTLLGREGWRHLE